MNIFSKTDYRLIISTVVTERKRLDASVNFQQIAAFVRMPKSHLSRVVHGQADLNTDQLYLVCQYLDFNEAESGYMQCLLEYARTTIKSRKAKLLREIRLIQAENLDTIAHLKPTAVDASTDEITAYYLDPLSQLAHVCLAIPRYQKDPALLATDLGVLAEKMMPAIKRLEQMQLVAVTKDGIKLLCEATPLPIDALVYKSYRNQWKIQALKRLDAVADDQAYEFSLVFSANDDVRAEIQNRFLGLLPGIEALVGNAKKEDAYQMSFELFPWTKKV